MEITIKVPQKTVIETQEVYMVIQLPCYKKTSIAYFKIVSEKEGIMVNYGNYVTSKIEICTAKLPFLLDNIEDSSGKEFNMMLNKVLKQVNNLKKSI